ncbi:hypothetical protein J5N97_015220 [Dioscorea zingiberensis]|uniref:DNA polymerase n=1 Tax=Dioscorea zingiberensis TaxID=325984 RepID=A0A9D5CTV9_9LILI|nr:hypothetical protein J5N97_015220 [Dioscorea zingiberensis]
MAAAPPETASSDVFSLRIVSMDYYMAPPIPDLDLSYSDFQGRDVEEVPVIRIYGSTPAGQKGCMHVHGALPYLYIPCPELKVQNTEEGGPYIHVLSLAIEKALSVKSNSALKRQHVHGCSIVRAKQIYGYHFSDELFVKIYLYYPYDVARLATLLLGGAILNRSFQPYESHIPYLLQFLVDYNLHGMSHIHTSKFKFRPPLPENVLSKLDINEGSSSDAVGNFAIWLSSTVRDDLIWPVLPTRHNQVEDKTIHLVRRQSVCGLELDTSVEDILNQNHKMYVSFSQTLSDVKMVQSLIPIWEEEYKRTGIQEPIKSLDSSKPLPRETLELFRQGLEYDKVFSEILAEGHTSSTSKNTSVETGMKIDEYIKTFADICSAIRFTQHERPSCTGEPLGHPSGEDENVGVSYRSLSDKVEDSTVYATKHEFQGLESTSQKISSFAIKDEDYPVIDTEALGLLSWLASSQASEELNTDDELVHEAILSPILSTKSYKQAVEIAHLDYENASQQECLDILDSVYDGKKSVGLKEQPSCPMFFDDKVSDSSGNVIPQVDGSSDDHLLAPDNCEISDLLNIEKEKYPQHQEIKYPSATVDCKSRRNKLPWGTLPLSRKPKDCEDSQIASENSSPGDDSELGFSFGKKGASSCMASKVNREVSDDKVGKIMTTCSVRDLMRTRRFSRSEHLESERHFITALPEMQKNEMMAGCPEGSNFHSEEVHYTMSDVTRNIARNGDEGLQEITINSSSSLAIDHSENKMLDDAKKQSDNCDDDIRLKDVEFPEEYTEMSFIRKPPSIGHMVLTSEDPSLNTMGAGEIRSGQKQELEDIPPFFINNFTDRSQRNQASNQDSALGVSVHFQNDGTALYLLTHATSPPSLDCVKRWISERVKHDELNNSSGDLCSEMQHVSNACHSLKPELLKSSEENRNMEDLECSSDIYVISSDPQELGIQSKEKALSCSFHDISQISGPDEKSNLTPLSQIGFLDPASIGAGQQLTSISIEIHTESRGDLQPDPQFDAINVVALVIQEDTTHIFDVHVLIRGNDEEPRARCLDGFADYHLLFFSEEKCLLSNLLKIISSYDPDILMGWEIQNSSLGYLAERASNLGINLLKSLSRTPSHESELRSRRPVKPQEELPDAKPPDTLVANTIIQDTIIEDEWGATHASGIHVGGRIVLNIWRLMRSEVKLNIYTAEAVAEEVLRRKVPSISCRVLYKWFLSGPDQARYRCIGYVVERAKLNNQIMNQLDMINRTSELARVFGIDFFSVLSRGSQFRVESMLLRLAHTQNYLAISPGNQQVALQPAMECLPLVMEPESGFYADPVVVLDFQSLYPSMIIAYNLCFCTCLGKVVPSRENILGVSCYSADQNILMDLKQQILITPNGVMYVPKMVRKGVLPRLLEEILSTRIMIKNAMKKLSTSQQVLRRIFNSRQLALKLIANVTYGYTAAGFSGRMPCAELADSIVQCGRRTLETAISFVNNHDKWKARVVYGDTDSMFVLLKGRSVEEAFEIGNEIAAAITAMNPDPVTLKMEKVYYPCFLLTKKRYVGYSFESPDQEKPKFDAKGIETIRRDTCPAVAKTLEKSLRIFFEHKNIFKVKSYLERQWTRILSGKVSLQDFVFAKEVRLGTYSSRASSLPPAAIVATKAMRLDPRAVPHYGERVPYIVIHGEPGARLIDMVVHPLEVLEINSPYRFNDLYYINKQIIPALQRMFGLLGADLNQWFSETPRPIRPTLSKSYSSVSHSVSLPGFEDNEIRLENSKKPLAKRNRIDTYYISKHCTICGELVQASAFFCPNCSKNGSLIVTTVVGRTSKLEREIQHLADICNHCGGGDWIIESGVKCTSLACAVFYERQKVKKELQAMSSFATAAGLYPCCPAEWF